MLIRSQVPKEQPIARGRCVYCGRTFRLNGPTGYVRKHYVIASPASATVKPGTRVVCGGSGRPPS